jgi:hypothetical protein
MLNRLANDIIRRKDEHKPSIEYLISEPELSARDLGQNVTRNLSR